MQFILLIDKFSSHLVQDKWNCFVVLKEKIIFILRVFQWIPSYLSELAHCGGSEVYIILKFRDPRYMKAVQWHFWSFVACEPSQYLSILILFAQRHIYPNCWIKCPAKNRNTLVSEVYHQVVITTWTQLEQLHIYLYFIFLLWHMPHDQNIPYWFPSLQKRNDPPWKR